MEINQKQNEIVVFELNNQHYGIDIKYVKEIVKWTESTSIPNTKNHIEGIINLRGKICNIINGRILFGFENKKFDDKNKIIVIQDGEIGITVDDVSEIIRVEESDIQPLENLIFFEQICELDYLVDYKDNIISVIKVSNIINSKKEEEINS